MFSLEVTPPHSCYREKHQVCSFLFSYNGLCFTAITTAKKKYCTKLQEDQRVKTFYGKKKPLEFPVVFF